MEFDLNKKYCYFFNEICQIPHPSYHEEKLADYLVQFAKDHNLVWKRDNMNNVIMYKGASEGYETSPTLGLQAHFDMVAEKNPGVDHDFLNDPLKLWVDEEGWLHASGTTLGADDGAGVAYILAILDDDSLAHPALEAIFTVQEEVGLLGALNLKKEDIQSHRIISLDGGGEYVTAISSAGGTNVLGTYKPVFEKADKKAVSVKVTGLSGGHSGGEIDKEKGNGDKLLARILKEMTFNGISFRICSISGGLKMNAICREATAIITTDATIEELQAASAKTVKDIKTELEFSDPGFELIVEEATAEKQMDETSTENLLNFLYLVPNGFRHKSMAIKDLTLTSLNLGILDTVDDTVTFTISIRSALDSGVSHLVETITTLANLFGIEVKTDGSYPGWNYKEKSAMRDMMNTVVQKMYGRDIITVAAHGGCECGVFCAMYEDMDILSIGANSAFIHTPEEKLDLASFDRAYELLTSIIALCK